MQTNPFLAAARSGKNDLWRYFVTVALSLMLLIIGTSLLSVIGYIGLAIFLGPGFSPDSIPEPQALLMAVLLLPFGFLVLGLWIGLRFLHHRPFRSLLRPEGRFRWGNLFLSAVVWLGLNGAGDLIVHQLQPGMYQFSYDPAAFWPYALVILLLIPIQVLAEESYFRGYLTQGIGLVGGFLAAWLIPAVLFGLLHGVNPEAGAYGLLYTLPVYIGSGLLLGWITLRSGGLEMALGLHLGNNLYGTLLVAPAVSALSGPSLFTQAYSGPVGLVVFVITVLVYLVFISFASGLHLLGTASNP